MWVRLYSDSYLLAFKKKGDREPKAKIFMKVLKPKSLQMTTAGLYSSSISEESLRPSVVRLKVSCRKSLVLFSNLYLCLKNLHRMIENR